MNNRKDGRLFDRMKKKKWIKCLTGNLEGFSIEWQKKQKKMEDSYGYGSGYGFMVSGMVYGLRVL